MQVMWAYPAGVTQHSPRMSPSAASNPAETAATLTIVALAELSFLLTDHEFRSKFCRNRHNDLLESVDIIRVGCANLRPGDIHRT
jgi:hypothetical protein